VIVEVSNQASPTKWAPVAFFAPGGEETVEVAARWMRATVTNYSEGSAPTVEVGGEDAGTEFATLVAPASSGLGAGVDTSALGTFKTVHVGGPFRGSLSILISQDGGASYQEALTFQGGEPGVQSSVFAADFMRVRRDGVPESEPGLPLINVGACDVGGGGGNVGNPQVFRYEADGTEGDVVTVPLPAARDSADYNVQVTLLRATASAIKVLSVVTSSLTTTEFDVELSADIEAGDILMCTVEDYS
jgi:hypothetical protein